MPKKIETLYKDDWMAMKKMVFPERDVNGYVYSHEQSCGGKKIAILPFRVENGMIQYLLRDEITPCWDVENPIVSSITGSYEKDKGVEGTVILELKEEAGYYAREDELISLGKCRGTKSVDTVYHLFTIDLTNKTQKEAKGDGSVLEAKAKCFWSLDLAKCEDPLAYVAYYRLNQRFIENIYTKK